MQRTPIHTLGTEAGCRLFVKREDLLPFSFGGNKARKAELFFQELAKEGADCVVTYGSSSSNHCRVVSNKAASLGMPCWIISPEEASERTSNLALMELFEAKIETVPVDCVHDTIEARLALLKSEGRKPYFIAGGGHGNLGTQAYVDCYDEIRDYERREGIHFDYIFHASGTGTTQAGLICGRLLAGDEREIIGISIARKAPRGRDVVLQSVRDYLGEGARASEEAIQAATRFVDDYTGDGYAVANREITATIHRVMRQYGLPLDPTYTGKAFTGMIDYLTKNRISEKNVLFIHTGGTPLFFDGLK
ncbi:MAG: pyridoxal-phosphate dependent enzyme [Lentisphaeria bacterium]|nr:pyridoxal-phosphate dependent enzyme [Lentisphaeria bacterium]